MVDEKGVRYGIFLIRVAAGIALLAHSVYLKIFVFTMAGTAEFFQSIGLPGVLAWIVLLVEAVTGVMLVLGAKSRYAAGAAIPVLLGATWAHSGNGWMFASNGGGWEYPLFWTVVLCAIALSGDGALSIAPSSRTSVKVRQRLFPCRAGMQQSRPPKREKQGRGIRGPCSFWAFKHPLHLSAIREGDYLSE